MIKAVTVGPKHHHFFGFHDLCPWDISGQYILAIETDFINPPPTANNKARICLIDLENDNKLEVLAETRAWNFHQGARLQWLPNTTNKVVYNDYDDNNNRFVSIILDIKTGEKKILPFPIYSINPQGDFGLGLNFVRLQKYGGYGYRSQILGGSTSKHYGQFGEVEPPNIDESFPRNDGIFRVDFKTREVKLIVSIYEVAHLNNSPRENEGHILTHITFNPSGSRICFIDKYRLPDGGFLQRLITADTDGNDLYVLPGHITHYDWRNDTEIFGYGKFSPTVMAMRNAGIFQNPLLKLLLNIVRKMRGNLKQKIAGQSYLLLRDKSQAVQCIALGVMTEDGHPQFSPDKKWVITDTYSNKSHYRTLILYNWNSGKRIDIEKFYSLPVGDFQTIVLPNGQKEPWDITEMRSDLHPRWNRDGTQICFDSVHDGTRQMYIVDIKDIVTYKDDL